MKKGDKVFLFIRNLKIKRLSKKLDWKKVGLFKVKKKVLTSNYEFDLPSIIRLRSKVFYVSLLKPVLKKAKLDTLAKASDDEEFDVKEILDLRINNG